MNLEKTLQENFGLTSFRRGQREILTSALEGRDVLAVLPTGGGKSLCYQLPAVAKEELVIVISPLIALMKDQVEGLRRRGIRAGCLHSGQPVAEKREVFREMAKGGAYLLYLSPERAQKEGFHRWFQQQKVALLAVDEAHCVSQWGHDFRPEYAQLNLLKSLRPEIPMLALTASATPLVLADIARNLGLKNPAKHVHGFYRPNLYYQVETCPDETAKFRYVKQALSQTPEGRVIVYCGTRRLTEEVAEKLSLEFAGVAHYHAGLSADERNHVQQGYSIGTSRILVATNAFGMGIDHPDVRLVVHFNMLVNIDSLYQEMGRAGRDGNPSTCLLLYAAKDKGLQSFFIQSSEAPAEIKRSRWNTLESLVEYAEGGECRHAEILTYYRDSQRLQRCGHCDACAPQSQSRIRKPPPPQRSETELRAVPKTKRKPGRGFEDRPLSEIEEMRFQLLREWRKRKADELDVPAFVIFSDRSMRQVARQNPSNLDELADLHGFGEVKVERFGRELLTALGVKGS